MSDDEDTEEETLFTGSKPRRIYGVELQRALQLMTTQEQCTRVQEILSQISAPDEETEKSRMRRARGFAVYFKDVMVPAFQEAKFPGVAAQALEGAMLRQIEEKSDDQDLKRHLPMKLELSTCVL